MRTARRLTTLNVLVSFFATVVLAGFAPPPVQAAPDLSAAEVMGLVGGAAVLGLLASQVGPIGIVAAGIAGGMAGSAALGTLVELFIKDWPSQKRILPIIIGALTGFAIGGTLLGMLAAQAPFLGVLAGIVVGGIAGHAIVDRLTQEDRPPPVPALEGPVPEPLDKASTGPLPPVETEVTDGGDVNLGALRQRVIEARQAFEKAAASGDPAARVQALLTYREAEQAFYRAQAEAAR